MPLGTSASSRSRGAPHFPRPWVCLFPGLLSILQLPKCSLCLLGDLPLFPFAVGRRFIRTHYYFHLKLFLHGGGMCCPLSVHINPSGLAGHSLKRRCHLGGRAATADLSGHFSSPGALPEEALTCWGELRVQVRLCVPGAWGGGPCRSAGRLRTRSCPGSWSSVEGACFLTACSGVTCALRRDVCGAV